MTKIITFLITSLIISSLVATIPDCNADKGKISEIKWSQEMRLTFSENNTNNPEIVIDSDNCNHIVWDEPTVKKTEKNEWIKTNVVYYMKFDSNGIILINKTLISPNGVEPAIAIDLEDNLYIVWVDRYDYNRINNSIFLKKQNKEGHSIINNIKLNDNTENFERCFADNPKLVIDSKNNINIVWCANVWWHGGKFNESISSDVICYKKLNPNGITVVYRMSALIEFNFFNNPEITIDSQDNVHIVWWGDMSHFMESKCDVYYKKIDQSGNISIDQMNITNSSFSSLLPKIEIDSNDNIHIVWYEYDNDNIYYKKLDNYGNNMTVNKQLTYSNSSIHPSLCIDLNNHVCIAYTECKSDRQIFYMELNNYGDVLYNNFTNMSSNMVSSSKIVCDSLNNIHIIWECHTDNDGWEIYYRHTLFRSYLHVPKAESTESKRFSTKTKIALFFISVYVLILVVFLIVRRIIKSKDVVRDGGEAPKNKKERIF